MVKIIKQGEAPKDRKFPATCRGCKSTLIFEAREGRYVDDQRDGDAMVFSCPVCAHEIWCAVAPTRGGW